MESSKPLPPYRYRPLEASSDSIRLLLLDPATIEDETLCGSLVTRSLSSFEDDLNTHYAALSYVWGDPSRTKSIELVDGGERFRHGLTANLHEALRNIREENRAIWIWADAICIDQNDISERGQQVKLMGDIYRGAGCTVIYLGHLNSEIKLLFEATIHQPVPEQIDQLRRAAEDLCSREWFKRGWVFQELILSHNPRVQCGRCRLGWNQLYSAIQHYLPSPSAGDIIRTMNAARNDHESRTFAQLVIARKGARVNDPRDYFFCLMGIASDSDMVQRFLPVDYQLGARDIFTKAAQLIANDKHVGLCALISHVDSDTGRLGLPSFVPTWGVSSLQSMSHDSPRQYVDAPLSRADIVGRSLVRSIGDDTISPVMALSAIIPGVRRFLDSLSDIFESRVPEVCASGIVDSLHMTENTSNRGPAELSGLPFGVTEELSRLPSYPEVTLARLLEISARLDISTLKIIKYLKRRDHKAYWISFWRAMQVPGPIHAFNSDQIEIIPKWSPALEHSIPIMNFHKTIFPLFERAAQDLHSSDDWVTNDTTPRYRWAYCDGLIALVPPDTVCGDVIARLDLGWVVVRPADHRVLQSERDAVAEHVRGSHRSNPKWKKNEDGVEDIDGPLTEVNPIESKIHYGEVKAAPTTCHISSEKSLLFEKGRVLPSWMVLI